MVFYGRWLVNWKLQLWVGKKNQQKQKMSTLSSKAGNLTNLRFCHCSPKLLLLSPTPPFLVPSSSQLPNSTPTITNRRYYYSSFSSICRSNRRYCAPPRLIRASSMASPSPPSSSDTTKPFSVLFVCLGNICRSPAAEGVFTDLVKKRGLGSNFKIDSCGTINYHEGNDADPRMRAAAKKRGIQITSISRPIKPSDFIDFDLILAMDMQNREDILEAFNSWKLRYKLPDDAHKKVKLMCSYCKKHDETEVPDPYYGGVQGFEKVLDLLEDACESLLENILTENKDMQVS